MIYKVVNKSGDKEKPVYGLAVYLTDKFNVPTKIYGSILSKVKYIWNVFASPNGRASVLCTGRPGSSKTLLCKLICNCAVDTHDISPEPIEVIVVQEIEPTSELIAFISTLDKCIVFIDEFGKIFRYNQDELLSLLSDNNKKRMFLLTENDSNYINSYILNRPERIRYHFEFDAMENSVITEYCKDYNVPEEFKAELLRLNMVNNKFNFDQLQTIVQEAQCSGRWDLTWLVSILNIKVLKSAEQYKPIKVTRMDNEDVALVLEPMIVKTGINIIKVTDRDLNTFGANSFNPVPAPYPSNDPFADLQAASQPHIQQPMNVNPTNVNADTGADKIKEDKAKLAEEIDKDYIDVDLAINDSRFEYSAERQARERLGNTYIKVNIDPSNIVNVVDNIYTYKDVLGKYKVFIEYGKKTY